MRHSARRRRLPRNSVTLGELHKWGKDQDPLDALLLARCKEEAAHQVHAWTLGELPSSFNMRVESSSRTQKTVGVVRQAAEWGSPRMLHREGIGLRPRASWLPSCRAHAE